MESWAATALYLTGGPGASTELMLSRFFLERQGPRRLAPNGNKFLMQKLKDRKERDGCLQSRECIAGG